MWHRSTGYRPDHKDVSNLRKACDEIFHEHGTSLKDRIGILAARLLEDGTDTIPFDAIGGRGNVFTVSVGGLRLLNAKDHRPAFRTVETP